MNLKSYTYSITSAISTLLYLSFLFLSDLAISIEAYVPVDSFTVNCGSTGNISDGERSWSGDMDSKFLSLQDTKTIVAQPATQPSPNKVPYTSARLSNSEFSYSFPVTAGRKFVRLFFYPASYAGFDRNNAFFTVKSEGFTLLKDFNASLNADAANSDTIFKEYIINVDDGQRINLTFTPNTSHPNSYAFVNGIEVVAMPSDLYFTEPSGQEVVLVGYPGVPYNMQNSSALQTDYRIKVGGNTITPKADTGMLRNWAGDDADYLRTPSALYMLSGDDTGKMKITVSPDYEAPIELYTTSRDMGKNGTLNQMINLTWEFPVDSGFTYMLRLHFCELDPNITKTGDRVFNIYIAGQLAEDRANVLRWSKQKGIAVQRDYAVTIPGTTQDKFNLSLQMHPSSFVWYSDPFLNGLEIFKISDPASNSLAGPNPNLSSVPGQPNPPKSTNSKSSNKATIIGVVVGAACGVVLLSAIAFFLLSRRNKPKTSVILKDSKSNNTSKWGPLSFATTKSTSTQKSSLPSDLCRHFSLVEIRAATNNFDDLFIVGAGGFGHVYKGYIDGGTTPVAIKRLKPGSQQGEHEFMNEIEMLSQLRHLHLVSLIGYCNESNEMILVYDFMDRGTLRDHLYNTENPSIKWKQRLQICIGAARGLHYLHTGAKHTIIHRDVKTTNILLDDKWVAKVSDFGLSRIGPTGNTKAHVSTVVKGSVGYLDPEYYKRQRLTEKSDVYSFGVVLFEILCARPPLIRTAEKKQVSLVDWARHCWNNGSLGQIVDPALKGSIAPECLRKFGEIAVSCLLDDGTLRPSMNDVVWMLEFALQLQESAEQRDRAIGIEVPDGDDEEDRAVEKREESDDMFSSGTSVGQVSDFNKSSGVSMMSSSGDNSYGNKDTDRFLSGTVFSEIMDPKAR
ncbi:receptor-like protein kinase FERONIA [Arachis stenosperma]|uniref:receptor-like protein kinase FERONIA n=1 Tax=Arachis stenosperma TaxID=217475 RepID=UPI0025AD7930|nr:receptor-like protein kinase FERONIA [Arachis stenosperma]